MTGWLAFAAYLVVGGFVGRALMRIVMSRPICTECRVGWFTGNCLSSHVSIFGGEKPAWVPMGELVERPVGIGVACTAAGLVWPLTFLVVVVMRAPAAPDELQRRNAEMSDTIRRFERDLRDGAR